MPLRRLRPERRSSVSSIGQTSGFSQPARLPRVEKTTRLFLYRPVQSANLMQSANSAVTPRTGTRYDQGPRFSAVSPSPKITPGNCMHSRMCRFAIVGFVVVFSMATVARAEDFVRRLQTEAVELGRSPL